MTLIDTLKADTLTARKNKDASAAVLRTVLGAIDTRSKQKGTVVDDALALSIIKSTLKGLEDTLASLENTQRTEAIAQTKLEIDTLTIYLPKQMSEAALLEAIDAGIKSGHTAIGPLMGYLKTNFEGQYDGKQASQLVRQAIEKAR